jgi:release factor glutamine methyltransferase
MRVGRILSKSISGVDAIDVEVLLTKVLNISRATLKAYPERELNEHEQIEFDALLQRRIKGEPVAYLVGHKEFWSLDFAITPEVLIPRADTELLVEIALELAESKKNMRILDLGTGSGAIALAVASERPDATVIATDVSAEALKLAKLNAKHNHIANVEFALGDWFEAIVNDVTAQFDIILSNPPYIANFDPHLSRGDLRFEPNKALVSGVDGMDALNIIISQAGKYLATDGLLLVEHGYDQETLVAAAFAAAGFRDIVCCKDLSGIPRVTYGILAP